MDRRGAEKGRASQPLQALRRAARVRPRPAPPEPGVPQPDPRTTAGTQPRAVLEDRFSCARDCRYHPAAEAIARHSQGQHMSHNPYETPKAEVAQNSVENA